MLAQILGEYSWLIFSVAAAVWLARVFSFRLARSYPALVSFLSFLVLYSLSERVIMHFTGNATAAQLYRWFYFVAHPLWWLLSFLVVLEVYHRMLSGYRGFQRLGELAKFGALGGVVIAIGAIILFDPVGIGPSSQAVRAVMLQQRAVYVALTSLCLLLASFAAFFHLPVPRNVQYVFAVFGVMFSGFAVLDTLQAHLGDQVQALRATAVPVLYVASIATGAYLFSDSGEEAAVAVPGAATLARESESIVVGRLEGFNELLLKVLRS